MELEEVRKLWQSRDVLKAGAVLYEAVPVGSRPAWAADILALACSHARKVPKQVRAVIEIAHDQARWKRGHDIFDAIRDLTLAEERSHAGGVVYECLLFVAENAAKIVYNASGKPAPFDEDCGDWLVYCLWDFVKAIDSPELEAQAWDLLESRFR